MKSNEILARAQLAYSPDHHFDRAPKTTDADAFTAGANYLQAQLTAAINDAKNGKKEDAIAAAGRALHALQDFKSHSNYIDLTADEQQQARDALFDPKKKPPENLKITGYDPKASIPGKSVGDPYAHDDFSKDNAKKNDEAKKKDPKTTP